MGSARCHNLAECSVIQHAVIIPIVGTGADLFRNSVKFENWEYSKRLRLVVQEP